MIAIGLSCDYWQPNKRCAPLSLIDMSDVASLSNIVLFLKEICKLRSSHKCHRYRRHDRSSVPKVHEVAACLED
jgi:hypothetical protein